MKLTEDGWYCFDITDFTKSAVADDSGMTESIGSVLTCEDGSALLATSDNGEFVPYIKLHLKNPPEYFIEHESINEVDWEEEMKKFKFFLLFVIVLFACGCGKAAEIGEDEVGI